MTTNPAIQAKESVSRDRWAILLTASLGVSCSVQAPAPVTVLEETIPAAWQGQAGTQEAAIDPAWWRAFGEPQLDTLIDQALERSFDLAAVAADVEAAAARARIAGAERWPQASARTDASRRQQIFVGLPIPGTDGVLPSRSTSFGISLDISWEADLWGRLRAGRSAAGEDREAARLDLEAARLSIAVQTAKAYFALRETNLQVALAKETLANRERSVERTSARYRRGMAPALDVRLARAERAQAEAQVHRLERVQANARRAIDLLLGHYPAGETVVAAGTLPEPPPAVPAGLPADLVARRPDLVAAERRLAASGWRVAEARAALYPRLSLTSSTGTLSNDVRDLLDNDFSIWNFAGGLLAPIFQGGRLRAAVELAEASRDRALAAYAGTVLRAFAEVETALGDDRYLARQEEALGRAGEEARRAAVLARDRYTGGVGGPGGFLRILEADRRTFAALSERLAVQAARLNQRIDLYAALGGGFGNPSE